MNIGSICCSIFSPQSFISKFVLVSKVSHDKSSIEPSNVQSDKGLKSDCLASRYFLAKFYMVIIMGSGKTNLSHCGVSTVSLVPQQSCQLLQTPLNASVGKRIELELDASAYPYCLIVVS